MKPRQFFNAKAIKLISKTRPSVCNGVFNAPVGSDKLILDKSWGYLNSCHRSEKVSTYITYININTVFQSCSGDYGSALAKSRQRLYFLIKSSDYCSHLWRNSNITLEAVFLWD